MDKVRLTGGEPLLRRDLPDLIAALASPAGDSRPGDDDQRRPARGQCARCEPGLHRLTVSLDTLRPDRFRTLTRFDELDRVLDGIAPRAPLFPRLKLDTVVIRGVNDDELVELIEFGRRSAPRCASSNTWTSAARRTGRWIASSRATRCSRRWPALRPRSRRSSKRRRRRPIATACRTARRSASSRPRREPFCEDCDRSRFPGGGGGSLCVLAAGGGGLRGGARGG